MRKRTEPLRFSAILATFPERSNNTSSPPTDKFGGYQGLAEVYGLMGIE
jgi:hypothetical protein